MFDVLTIGDSTLDTFLILEEGTDGCSLDRDTKHLRLHYGDKIPIVETAQSVGGNAANLAVGLSKLGLSTAIVTELGDDPNAATVKHDLEEAGVDTSYVKMLKGKDTRYSIVLNYEAERTVLSAHVPRTYTFPRIAPTKWVYYTSLGKSFEVLQKKLVSYLDKHPDTKLALNPGSYQGKQGMRTLRQILPRVDILFVNKEEAEAISEEKKSIASTMSALHKSGVTIVVMTDGTKGSYVSDGREILHMDIYPIKPIAKTGAGDAFASGFLAAYIKQHPIPACMQWGTANSACVIGAFGAQKGLCTQTKIKRMVRKYKRISPKTL